MTVHARPFGPRAIARPMKKIIQKLRKPQATMHSAGSGEAPNANAAAPGKSRPPATSAIDTAESERTVLTSCCRNAPQPRRFFFIQDGNEI